MSPVALALAVLYAQLPRLVCQRKCQASCGPIELTPGEAERLLEAVGPETLAQREAMVCPLLDAQGACRVYPIRPLICRLWGMTRSMRCAYGCVPERWVSDEEARGLLAEAERVAGGPMERLGAPHARR